MSLTVRAVEHLRALTTWTLLWSAESRCAFISKKSGRQCSCRITREEPHFGKDKTGFIHCNSCYHALGLHPAADSKLGSPPLARSVSFAASSSPSSAAAAAAALVTIGRPAAAAAAAAAAEDVELLEPIDDDTRKRFKQLDERNTAHAASRVTSGNNTRVQLTIMHYPLAQPLLAAFVNHLKVSKDRQPAQVRVTFVFVRVCL